MDFGGSQVLDDKQFMSKASFDLGDFLDNEMKEHRLAFEALRSGLRAPFDRALTMLEAGIRAGGKILLFGNGGSAADAQHVAAELMIRYKDDRVPIAAISLTTDTSALTACGNDLGFETIFSRQIDALARAGDVAVGISTSGRSPNVLAGLRLARVKGVTTIGLTGGNGGDMDSACDVAICVPSSVTARIQEMHILVGHMLCKALELRLGLM